MTPAELFWATAFLSSLLIRLLADYVKIRLHITRDKRIRIFFLSKRVRVGGVHIHHFVWGIISAFIAIAVLYHGNHHLIEFGMFCAGLAASLIASEAKELLLQKWGR
jgi:hypothetical protein